MRDEIKRLRQVLVDEVRSDGDSLGALTNALAAATDRTELAFVLEHEVCEEGVHGEAAFPTAVASLLLEKATTWSDTDRAEAWGWLRRLSRFSPYSLLIAAGPHADAGVKQEVAAIVDAAKGVVVQDLTSDSVSVRAAAAQLLMACRNVSPSDLDTLYEVLRREKSKEPEAAMLVALGTLAARLKALLAPPMLDEVTRRLASGRDATDLRVAACAALGHIVLTAEVTGQDVDPLRKALAKPPRIPKHWAWFSMASKNPLQAALWTVLSEVRVLDPAGVLALLREEPTRATAPALVNLAFHGRGKPMLTNRADKSALDDLQVEILELFRAQPLAACYAEIGAFGVPVGSPVGPFLDGKGPEWMPLALDWAGIPERLVIAGIVQRLADGTLGAEEGARAVLAALPDEEVFRLVLTDFRSVKAVRSALDEVGQSRVWAFIWLVLLGLEERGFKLEENLLTASKSLDFTGLWLGLALAAHYGREKREPPAECDRWFGFAAWSSKMKEPLWSTLSRLEPDRLERILAIAPCWLFWPLCLRRGPVIKMVEYGRKHPEVVDQLTDLLTGGDEITLTTLRELRASAPELLDPAIERLSARLGAN